MTLSFREFVPKFNDGTIVEDAAWRAYDIEKMATQRKALDALKTLGYRELNLFGLDKCSRDYGLKGVNHARQLLSLWWTWARIALGEVRSGLIKRENTNGN